MRHIPLLTGLAPAPEESGASFLSRLAALNGCWSTRFIVDHVEGPARPNQPWRRDQLERLAEAAHVSCDRLEPLFRCDDGGADLWRGHRLAGRQLEGTRMKTCPQCLAANSRQSALYDLRAVGTCPTHDRPLLDACPACGRALTLSGPSPCHCEGCFADLRDVFDVEPQAATGDQRGVRLIARKAGFGLIERGDDIALDLFDRRFGTPSLSATIDLIDVLGRLALGPASGRPWTPPGQESADQRREFCAAGGRVLAEWPRAFNDLLNGIIDKTQPEPRCGTSMRFAWRSVLDRIAACSGRWSEIERLWLHVIAAQTAALSPLRKTRALGARLASVAAGRRRAAADDPCRREGLGGSQMTLPL